MKAPEGIYSVHMTGGIDKRAKRM